MLVRVRRTSKNEVLVHADTLGFILKHENSVLHKALAL